MRRVIEMTVRFEYDFPDRWDEESMRFKAEENRCRGNFINDLYQQMEKDGKHCNICIQSKAKLLASGSGVEMP